MYVGERDTITFPDMHLGVNKEHYAASQEHILYRGYALFLSKLCRVPFKVLNRFITTLIMKPEGLLYQNG